MRVALRGTYFGREHLPRSRTVSQRSGMCFRMRISQNSHAMRKFCEISHSHRIAEPISDSHNFRKMRTKFSHAKNSHYAKLSPNATFRMRIFWKCEFMRNANFCEVRIFAKCEFSQNANLCEMRTFAFDFSRKVRNNIIKKFSN